MKKICFLMLCVSLLAGSSEAQTTVPANTPVTIEWDHDGIADGYRLIVDAVATDLGPLTPSPSGSYETTYAGFTVGTHTVEVAAYNQFGETTSGPVSVTAGVGPSVPTELRIVIPTS